MFLSIEQFTTCCLLKTLEEKLFVSPLRRKSPSDSTKQSAHKPMANFELAQLLKLNMAEQARKLRTTQQSKTKQVTQPTPHLRGAPPLDESVLRFMNDPLSHPLPETLGRVLMEVRGGKAIEGITLSGEGFIVKTPTRQGLTDFSFKLDKDSKIVPDSIMVNKGSFGGWQKPSKSQLKSFSERMKNLSLKRW